MPKLPTVLPTSKAEDWEFETAYPHINQSLATLHQMLPEHSATANVHLLLDAESPKIEVQKLEPQTLYQLIETAEWEDARELLKYVSDYQLQCLIDMDAWQYDILNAVKLERWFDALVDVTSDEDFTHLMRELDPEIPALLFKANLIAEPIVEDEDPFGSSDIQWRLSPDGTYALADIGDEDSAALMRKLINRMYDTDRVLVWTLIEASRWEQMSEVQHQAYRWRTSRMEELGYPEKTEALSVFAFNPPSKVLEEWREGKLPSKRFPKNLENNSLELYARIADSLLIFDAFESLAQSQNFSNLVAELVTLQNYALIANGIEPGHQFQAQEEARKAIGYLNIGLEFLSQNDLEEAKLLVKTLPLKKIFSVGYSAASTVKRQVQALEKRSLLTVVEGEEFSLLNPEKAALFQALTEVRPETVDAAGNRKFMMHISDVEAASQEVQLVAFKQLWLFSTFAPRHDDLGAFVTSSIIANSPIDITFDLLFRNANANTLIGEKDPFRPFNLSRLAQLISKIQSTPNLANFASANDDQSPFLPFLEKVAGSFPPDALRQASRWLTETLKSLIQELLNITNPEPDYLMTILLIER